MSRKPATSKSFIASFSFDQRLAPFDLVASIAHAEMLGRCRILVRTETNRLVRGLKSVERDLARGKRLPRAEDVHYAIEEALRRKIGRLAGKLHTARSRNDQTVTALRLYVRSQVGEITRGIRSVQSALVAQVMRAGENVMPGLTHLQPAQPLLLGQHLLAYVWMLERDNARLEDAKKRLNQCPLGSAALAGTSFPIDREWISKRLGFFGPMENSVDAVSERDFLLEILSAFSILMIHVSRLAEELVNWSSPFFGFVRIGAAFTSGSSIMPQKQNPDVAELLRGKSGGVIGDLVSLLVNLKGQPLAYNRDLQEDKPPIFDAVDTVRSSLDVLSSMLPTLRFDRKRMEAVCEKGHLWATDLADELTKRGLPFREAHRIIREVISQAEREKRDLRNYSLSDWRKFSPLFGNWVNDLFSPRKLVERRKSAGGTSWKNVQRQIQALQKKWKSR